ncbi:MAG: hypothetical protein LAO51_10630 [Acidobacteriia bacterium]|nr:hypothetical protein [Terriglobia bacterium]
MRPLVVAIAFLATGWAFGAGVDLELRSATAQQLVLEPPDLHLVLVNHGAEPVSIALSSASRPRLRIQTDDGWFDCKSSLAVCPGVSAVPWTRIQHGAEVELGPLPLLCPSAAVDAHGAVKEWVEVPARYRFQAETRLAVPAQSAGGTAAPDNAFTGALTSTIVSIDVNEPSGVDAQALSWAREHNDTPMSWAAVRLFPGSRYAALALLPYIDIGKSDPSRVRTIIERGQFLSWGSVPDSDTPDGWASLSGAELANWRIERAERILRNHPNLPSAGQLRLAIGVNQIASGKGNEGRKLLRQLASHTDTREGAWAKEFLGIDGP